MMQTKTYQALQETLESHTFFKFLTRDELSNLIQQSTPAVYGAGETVFLEGEPANFLWWIETGSVKIYKLSPEGNEQILKLASSGEFFNEIAVYDEGGNPANVETLTQATIWRLPAEIIRSYLMQNNTFAKAVIKSLASRVRHFNSLIETLTLYSVTARLARFLLQQAENASLDNAGITRKAIAAHLATTPETISRTLHTLQDAGAVRFDRHRIVIVNANTLRSIAMM